AGELHAAATEGHATGLLFGAERAGLETADIAFCQAIVTIPIDPKFRSLNLAQAVAINGYEWRATIDAGPPPGVGGRGGAGEPGRAGRALHPSGDRAGGVRLLLSAGKDAVHGAQSA